MAFLIGTPIKVSNGVVMLAPPNPVIEPINPAKKEITTTSMRLTMSRHALSPYIAV